METETLALSGTAAAVLFAVHRIAVILAKTIPDSAEGFPAFVRTVAKIIAMYVPNQK